MLSRGGKREDPRNEVEKSTVVTSLREDSQAFSRLSCTKIHSIWCVALEIQIKFTMSSESSELETRFDSDDLEINFFAV